MAVAQKRRAASTGDPQARESANRQDRIAQRAYERYEARGREDGRDLDDWLEAEREIERNKAGKASEDIAPDENQIA